MSNYLRILKKYGFLVEDKDRMASEISKASFYS